MVKNRLLIILLILLLFASPLGSAPAGNHLVFAQSVSQYMSFEIGYGPNALFPAPIGIPTFAYNDEMWLYNNYSFPVSAQLSYSVGSTQYVIASGYFEAQSIGELYGFTGLVEQNWNLTVSGSSKLFSIPITYIAPSAIKVPTMNYSAYFSNQQLVVNFSYSEPTSYNPQACVTGEGNLSSAQIPIPSSLGSGSIALTPSTNSDSAQVLLFGSMAKSSIFWFETYYSYTYAEPNSTGLVSSQVETSRSSPELLSKSATNVTVQDLVSLRPGRYVLRAYFDDGVNVSISQTSVLVQGNFLPWVWLGGCESVSQSSQTNFVSRTSISGSPTSRPRYLYLIYEENGIDAYKTFEFNISIGEVVFKSAPLNAPLTNIGILLVSNPLITSSEYVGGTMYMILSGPPVNAVFNVTFLGVPFATDSVVVYSVGIPTVNIPLGVVSAKVTNNGQPVSNASATLNGSSFSLSGTTNKQGSVDFYVPPGSYSASVTYSGVTLRNSSASVSAGQNKSIAFSFSVTPPNPPDYLTPLIVVLVLGVAANALVWVWGIRRRRAYVA